MELIKGMLGVSTIAHMGESAKQMWGRHVDLNFNSLYYRDSQKGRFYWQSPCEDTFAARGC